MNIRNKDILGCFPLLASVLGDKYGVDIRIGGDKAMTDGKVISIPAMPAELDDDMLEAARGYVDHESAHIRYTDIDAMRNAKLDKLEQWLFNSIEDWRVEKKLASVFPGCGHNFRKLIKRLFGETARTGSKNPVLSVLDYALLTARSWTVPEVTARLAQTAQILDENFPTLRSGMDALLMEIPGSCDSTAEAITHAQKLGACIRQYFNDPKMERENPANLQDEGENRGEGKSGGSSSSRGDANQQNQNSGQYHSGQPDKTSTSSHSQNNDAKGGATEPQDSPANPANPENSGCRLNDLDALLSDGDEDAPQNLGDMLSARLDAQATPNNDEGVIMATAGKKEVSAFSPEERMEAMRNSVAMRQRLAGFLQARTLKQGGTGRNGKLNSAHLHRICVGNAKVFRRKTERTALDTAVHILLDCSSSMRGMPMSVARKACYALVKSLVSVKGVNLAVTAFPADDEDVAVYPAIRHGQMVKEMPALEAFGDTPLGPALWWVMREMLPLKESRKLIIILTDGVPNSVKAAKLAISQCQKLKMEVMGIGIQTASITHLLPKSGKVIWQINELAPAMFELMRNALLNGGGK